VCVGFADPTTDSDVTDGALNGSWVSDERVRCSRIESEAGHGVTAGRPEFLTVEQTAAVCGIGRTVAYQLARRAADHGEGDFPAVRFGKQLRVPRRKLEALIGGPITLPTDPPTEPDRTTTEHDHTINDHHHRTTTPNTTTPTTEPDQPQLPLTTP
jgi:hypothetical protein